MRRRPLFPLVALVMLLASLFSTETAEVWCRVAVGATMDADDDDGPYFSCRSRAAAPVPVVTPARAALSAAANAGSIVDEPTFHLPPFGMIVLPGFFPQVAVTTPAVAYGAETRGPPTLPGRFARPPPRGPPIS